MGATAIQTWCGMSMDLYAGTFLRSQKYVKSKFYTRSFDLVSPLHSLVFVNAVLFSI